MKIRSIAWIAAVAAAFLWIYEPLKHTDPAATCVSKHAKRSDVIAACTGLIEADGTAPEHRHLFLTERAWAHRCNGHYERGIEDVDQALELQPENVKTWVLRARIHASNDNHEAALKDYDKAVELAPEYSYTHWNRARYLDRQRERSEAFEGYKRTLELNPNASNAAKHIVNHYYSTGEFEKALESVAAAKVRWPDKLWVYDAQIRLDLIHTHDVDSALEAAEKYINLADDTIMEFIVPAAIHLTIGNDERGIATTHRYVTWYQGSVAAKHSKWDWITGKSTNQVYHGESGKPLLRGEFYLLIARDDLARPELLQFWEMSDQTAREEFLRIAMKSGAEVSDEDRANAESIIDAYIEQELKDVPSWSGRK